MPQTFYVTQDEEILSIVGRLRSSALLENVFIIPKRALILQSIVNLRILAKEAEKLGKGLVIVTQDEDGRKLAEKAGIATKTYSEEAFHERDTNNIDGDSPGNESPRMMSRHSPTSSARNISIGSSEFFSASQGAPLEADSVAAPPTSNNIQEMRIRIRDNTPKNLTSLNSSSAEKSLGANQEIRRPTGMDVGSEYRQNRMAQASMVPNPPVSARQASRQQNVPIGKPQETTQIPTGRLTHVFQSREERLRQSSADAPKFRKQEPARRIDVQGKGRMWFFLFSVVSILSLLGTGAFLFLPSVEVTVLPKSLSKNTELSFQGKTGDSTGEKDIPARIIEKELEVSVVVETSGSTSGTGEKARGKVIIYNDYSSDPQPLVATTRLETPDGKIFRLARGITVPGISEISGKKEPGATEAEVIADETGESYNIGPSTFSIPGFKGSQKYEKFSAKSKEAMSGGSSESDAKDVAVSSGDIAKAKAEADKKFRELFEEATKSDVSENERIIPESMETSLAGTPIHPQSGVAASSFEYKATYKGKVFAISEDTLKEKAARIILDRPDVDEYYEKAEMSFEYGSSRPDYASGTLEFGVRANAFLIASIDEDMLKKDLSGKGKAEINSVLEKYHIQKIDIVFKPVFLMSIPENVNRILVEVKNP